MRRQVQDDTKRLRGLEGEPLCSGGRGAVGCRVDEESDSLGLCCCGWYGRMGEGCLQREHSRDCIYTFPYLVSPIMAIDSRHRAGQVAGSMHYEDTSMVMAGYASHHLR